MRALARAIKNWKKKIVNATRFKAAGIGLSYLHLKIQRKSYKARIVMITLWSHTCSQRRHYSARKGGFRLRMKLASNAKFLPLQPITNKSSPGKAIQFWLRQTQAWMGVSC